MERAREGGRAPLVIYTIVKRPRDGKSVWVRIGNAFENRDGSLSGLLDAVPTNGTLHIREAKPFEARPFEPSSTPLRPANGPPHAPPHAAGGDAE